MKKLLAILVGLIFGTSLYLGGMGAYPKGYPNDISVSTLCDPQWSTKTIRPPVSYTSKIKKDLMKKQHLSGELSDYELDHIIALTNGGHPTDLRNLQMQAYLPQPGAREKDRVEVYIHKKLCRGELTLRQAQKIQTKDWVKVYNEELKNHFGGAVEYDEDDD